MKTVTLERVLIQRLSQRASGSVRYLFCGDNMNVESFETYLLERGSVAVVLASVIVVWIILSQPVHFGSLFGSVVLSVLIGLNLLLLVCCVVVRVWLYQEDS